MLNPGWGGASCPAEGKASGEGSVVKGFLRRSWLVTAAVAAVASIFAVTALAGFGRRRRGISLTYNAAPGEVNSLSPSRSAGTSTGDLRLGRLGERALLDAPVRRHAAHLRSLYVAHRSDDHQRRRRGNDSGHDRREQSTAPFPRSRSTAARATTRSFNHSNRAVTFIGGPGNDAITGQRRPGHGRLLREPLAASNVDLTRGGRRRVTALTPWSNIGNVIGSTATTT